MRVRLPGLGSRKPAQLSGGQRQRVALARAITFVYVTHDQEEALTMSDRIAVLNHGRIEQIGTPVFTAGAQNTLPLWIFGAIRLGQQLPEVNAVVSIVILLTIIPVVLAARLAGAGAVTRSARNVPVS